MTDWEPSDTNLFWREVEKEHNRDSEKRRQFAEASFQTAKASI